MFRQRWQGEQVGFWWWLTIAVLYAPAGAIVKLRYRHDDRIPRSGPAILVCNHVSHLDPFMMCRLTLDAGRLPRFMAKNTIFEVPIVGAAMLGMGHISVQRGSTDAAVALRSAVAALESGRVILMHPEGTVTRDPDGWPMVARTGVARLALLAPDVPVIPVGQWGIQDAYDLYQRRIRPFPRPIHSMSVGEPVDLSAFAGAAPSAETLRQVTDEIMRAVRAQVAQLRGVPAPTGGFFRWVRAGSK